MAGKPVVVEGKVSKIIEQGKYAVINFQGVDTNDFFAVVSQDQSPDAHDYLVSPDGRLLVHKKIRLTDGISLYNGTPFMGITDLRQIELVDERAANSPQH